MFEARRALAVLILTDRCGVLGVVRAAAGDGGWLIRDNGWLTLARDIDMTSVTPIFLLDENDLHYFVPSNQMVPNPSASRSISGAYFFRLARF
jgi:hypothetical protein